MYISHSRQLQSILTADNVKCTPQSRCCVKSVLTRCSLYIRDERPDGIQKFDLRCTLRLVLFCMVLLAAILHISLSTSDYAKFDEIVHMSYLYSRPKVQEWAALRAWQAPDQYTE